MNKIAITICGSSGIDYVNPNHGLKVFRSSVVINGKEYQDYIDISADKFYQLLEDEDPDVHTAQVSTGTLVKMFEELKEEGYTDVIAISISSGLSGTYQGLYVAKDLVTGINVYPFDSLFIGFAEAKLALVAKEMVEKGYQVKEILDELTRIRDSHHFRFVVDDLKYLVKNGRLSSAKGFIADVFNIKPILMKDELGRVVMEEKIRSKKRAINRALDLFLKEIEGKDVQAYIVYTNNLEEVKVVKDIVLFKAPNLKNIGIYPLPPVIGVHSGPRALGIGYFSTTEFNKY